METNWEPSSDRVCSNVEQLAHQHRWCTRVFIDGVPVGRYQRVLTGVGLHWAVHEDSMIVPVSAGVHKVDLYRYSDGGGSTVTRQEDASTLMAREI